MCIYLILISFTYRRPLNISDFSARAFPESPPTTTHNPSPTLSVPLRRIIVTASVHYPLHYPASVCGSAPLHYVIYCGFVCVHTMHYYTGLISRDLTDSNPNRSRRVWHTYSCPLNPLRGRFCQAVFSMWCRDGNANENVLPSGAGHLSC